MRKKSFFIVQILILILFVSCGRDRNVLVDGYYTAEAAKFDSYGWKEYLVICVSNGRIIFVEYNAFNPAGFIKSWDMDYMRRMNAVSGTYPNAYNRHYAGLFLENQDTKGIDALSGASDSYRVFIALANSVLAHARAGDKRTSLVNIGELH